MLTRTTFSLLILAGLLLAACQAQPATPAAAQPTRPAGQPVITATSVPLPTPVSTAASLPVTSSGPSGAAALIMEGQDGSASSVVVPVAADTGQPLEGYHPLTVGGQAAFGFSNDRSEMAYVSYQPDECATYCLSVMNLRSWKRMAVPIPIDTSLVSWFAIPAFDANSSLIPVIVNKKTDTVSEVLLADRSQSRVTVEVSLPASIFQAARTPEGHLAVYGLQSGQQGTQPEMYLALLDGDNLKLLWSKTLPDLPLYVVGDEQNGQQSRYYEHAAAFSPDGSKLHLVAADRPLLITVDLQKKTIQMVKIQPKTSWLDRLLAASVVYAKTMNGINKTGVLSADGRYFYVLGQETKEVQNAQGGFEMERTPLGLQVIDTETGELVREVDTTAGQLALSVDGKSLLLHGWEEGTNGNGIEWTDVLDLKSFEVTQRLDGVARPSRLLDGSQAWLVTGGDSGNPRQIDLFRPGDSSALSRVVRPGYVDWILIP